MPGMPEKFWIRSISGRKKMFEKHGIHFVHASDEWYLLAGEELPEEDRYDGYLQLENGVGMLRLLETEVREAVKERTGDRREIRMTAATGKLQPLTLKNVFLLSGKNIRILMFRSGLLPIIFLEK